jgi:hypothetical protein
MRAGWLFALVSLFGMAACSTVIERDPEGDDGAGAAPSAGGGDGATAQVVSVSSAVTTRAASSSSTGRLEEPRLPPCNPAMVDDFEDPAHTEATWANAVVEDGRLILADKDVVGLQRASEKPFEDCRISLRLVTAEGLEGSLHCHLDPDLDPDHDYVNFNLRDDGVNIELQSGSGLGVLNGAPTPTGRLVALLFDGPRVRGLVATEDETAWVELFDELRPEFLDLPFSPCAFSVFTGTGSVDDVNVLPPALYGL